MYCKMYGLPMITCDIFTQSLYHSYTDNPKVNTIVFIRGSVDGKHCDYKNFSLQSCFVYPEEVGHTLSSITKSVML